MTAGEVRLARTVFGEAIDYEPVRIRRRKWFPFQPRKVTMAPNGHVHFHPHGQAYSEDFAAETITRQGLLIHELTHVWQTQTRGDWYLVLNRHPLCRYEYTLTPDKPFEAYGIEQQAEIVKHAFWLRHGFRPPGLPEAEAYAPLVAFQGATLG